MPSVLIQHSEPLALAALPVGSPLPEWATAESMLAWMGTARHSTVLCNAFVVPPGVTTRGPFVGFEVAAVLDPSLTGLLAQLCQPLADAGLSILPVSMYDQGWVLIQRADAKRAARLWRDAGFEIVEETP